ncbi:hypothetical protein GH733_005583 [Mirounga leonina]|nr:hypothetical protein GH733_005583 [Mirounga leonina]
MRCGRAPVTQTDVLPQPRTATDGSVLCLLEMKPGFLLSAARRPVALLFTILFFMSQALPGNKRHFAEALLRGDINSYNNPLFYAARGRFKEVCERPNGDCQEFCLESERQAGICLNGQSCCLPMGNEPIIEPTTPKE